MAVLSYYYNMGLTTSCSYTSTVIPVPWYNDNMYNATMIALLYRHVTWYCTMTTAVMATPARQKGTSRLKRYCGWENKHNRINIIELLVPIPYPIYHPTSVVLYLELWSIGSHGLMGCNSKKGFVCGFVTADLISWIVKSCSVISPRPLGKVHSLPLPPSTKSPKVTHMGCRELW